MGDAKGNYEGHGFKVAIRGGVGIRFYGERRKSGDSCACDWTSVAGFSGGKKKDEGIQFLEKVSLEYMNRGGDTIESHGKRNNT